MILYWPFKPDAAKKEQGNKAKETQSAWAGKNCLVKELTAKVELWTSAQRMNDVDDQAVGGSSKGKWTSGHQQGHYMEEVGEMRGHIEWVVKGEHQHVTG